MKFTDVNSLERKAAGIRLSSLSAINNAGRGHTGSCMSIVEILVALYYGQLAGRPVMNFDSGDPGHVDQDYLVLSKGQAAPVQYSILSDLGFFDKAELDFLSKEGALLSMEQGAKIPGVSFSNFISGHGLSVSVGLALSLKMDRRKNRVYSVIGDGELQSGQTWEAIMSAAHYKLDNLVCIVDNNKVQGASLVNNVVDLGSIQDKFEAFGWSVIQVSDGHDFERLLYALHRSFTSVRKPICLWCRTVPSKGIDFAEGKADYQNVPLSDGELAAIKPVLERLKEFV